MHIKRKVHAMFKKGGNTIFKQEYDTGIGCSESAAVIGWIPRLLLAGSRGADHGILARRFLLLLAREGFVF